MLDKIVLLATSGASFLICRRCVAMFRHSLALLAGLVAVQAQALTTGDLAFTSFNAVEDGWSVVAFVDIAANTKVYFSDNEWNGAAFSTGEDVYQWHTGSSVITAGTVVRFSAINSTARAATKGTFSWVNMGFAAGGLNNTNETLYAYTGTNGSTPTVFLAGVTNDGVADDLSSTGLLVASAAIQLAGGTDFGEYTGPRTGAATFANYKAMLSDSANWVVHDGPASWAAAVPSTALFTVSSAVPEPQSLVLLMAGLGVAGAASLRREKRTKNA